MTRIENAKVDLHAALIEGFAVEAAHSLFVYGAGVACMYAVAGMIVVASVLLGIHECYPGAITFGLGAIVLCFLVKTFLGAEARVSHFLMARISAKEWDGFHQFMTIDHRAPFDSWKFIPESWDVNDEDHELWEDAAYLMRRDPARLVSLAKSMVISK